MKNETKCVLAARYYFSGLAIIIKSFVISLKVPWNCTKWCDVFPVETEKRKVNLKCKATGCELMRSGEEQFNLLQSMIAVNMWQV